MSRENPSQERMELSDSDLILRARNGDTTAFEQLIHRYDRQVFSMAARYVTTAEDAKDIYQEVFLRVYRGLPKFKQRSEFSTWLFRITTNVCLNHRSRQKRHAHRSLREEADAEDEEAYGSSSPPKADISADQHALDSDIGAHVEEALGNLSRQQRLVFTLRHYEGLKLKEIAKMMHCGEGTVKRYLFTATQRMRDQLKGILD